MEDPEFTAAHRLREGGKRIAGGAPVNSTDMVKTILDMETVRRKSCRQPFTQDDLNSCRTSISLQPDQAEALSGAIVELCLLAGAAPVAARNGDAVLLGLFGRKIECGIALVAVSTLIGLVELSLRAVRRSGERLNDFDVARGTSAVVAAYAARARARIEQQEPEAKQSRLVLELTLGRRGVVPDTLERPQTGEAFFAGVRQALLGDDSDPPPSDVCAARPVFRTLRSPARPRGVVI